MANLETKLKALLAAGLIGTAGLGMQSCSNPSDSVYYPYTVEAPSTDNPGSGGGTENPGNGGGAETSNPSGSDGVETVEEMTFEKLGVNENDAIRLRNVTPMDRSNGLILIDVDKNMVNRVYMGKNVGFKTMSKLSDDDVPILYENTDDLPYLSEDGGYVYHIPANMAADFIKAGANLQ